MKIKKNSKSRSGPWRAVLIGFLLFAVGAGIFICRQQSLSKLSSKLHLEAPAQALSQTLGSALPSLELLPKLTRKMTILLMGVDSNGVDTDPFQNTRSDTMMLLSVDPTANKVAVISIPRDSRVHIPNHGTDKINAAHALGGAQLAMQTLSETFGIPVDHYVEVDTAGLKKLFEILGPVEVLVEREMHYVDHTARLTVDLQPGLQQLSPEQAEQYVRYRNDGKGDIGRIERQQWFIRQAARKLKEPQVVLKLPQLMYLAYECIRTDLPLQDALSIAAYAKDFPQEKILTATLPGDARYIGGGSYWVPDVQADQEVFGRLLGITPVPAQTCEFAHSALAPQNQFQTVALTQAVHNGRPLADGEVAKPLTVAIKYPAGCESLSAVLADQLTQGGFKIKYRFQIAAGDCQHEVITQQSLRVSEDVYKRIYHAVPDLQGFPVSLTLESRPTTDFTIIISPTSQLPSLLPRTEDKPVALGIGATGAVRQN